MDFEKQEFEDLFAEAATEPDRDEWAAPTVLVTKTDELPRFCVEYRKLTTVTVREWYP